MEKYKSEKWLKNRYLTKEASGLQIAKECGCSRNTIYNWLRKYGIPLRDGSFQKGNIPKLKKYFEPSICVICGNPFPTEKRTKTTYREACSLKCAATLRGLRMRGRKLSEEHRKKISNALLGEKHPRWLGGKSFEPYSVEFNNKLKEEIRERDRRKCQECGYTEKQLGYKLSCHHIDYDKKNNKPENLISLCIGCHRQTQFNRDDWVEYFRGKLSVC